MSVVMKCLLITCVLFVTAQAASQRKSFQENFSDFNELIIQEIGEKLFDLFDAYEEELVLATQYLDDQDFAQLINEMEQLPEFNALIDFMEENGIEIHFYIAVLHDALGLDAYEYLRINKSDTIARQAGDSALSRYLRQLIDLLPMEQLRTLYEEKVATDDEFRSTMENLQSQEFADLWSALWDSEVFRSEVDRLRDHDIEFEVVIDFILATMGLLTLEIKA